MSEKNKNKDGWVSSLIFLYPLAVLIVIGFLINETYSNYQIQDISVKIKIIDDRMAEFFNVNKNNDAIDVLKRAKKASIGSYYFKYIELSLSGIKKPNKTLKLFMGTSAHEFGFDTPLSQDDFKKYNTDLLNISSVYGGDFAVFKTDKNFLLVFYSFPTTPEFGASDLALKKMKGSLVMMSFTLDK